MVNDKLEILKKFPFWETLSDIDKESLSASSRTVSYKKGESLFSAERECLGVLKILNGEIRAYIISDEGREVTLYRLLKDDVCILSASCIMHEITFDVFISAETDSEVLLINPVAFDKIQKKNLQAENFALKTAVSKFSDVMWAMEQMLFYKFDKRLALFLIDESNKKGSDTLNYTHEQIAKYIGSAREVVSRTLKSFEHHGIVALSNGEIIIVNKEELYGLVY